MVGGGDNGGAGGCRQGCARVGQKWEASKPKTCATSRSSVSTLRRARRWSSQHREVKIQRRDVTERVYIQHCNVPKRL